MAVYVAAGPLTFAGLFLLGERNWIALVALGLVVVMASFERCPACGGALMLFGYKRSPHARTWICKSCWEEGGLRKSGISDPEPPRP